VTRQSVGFAKYSPIKKDEHVVFFRTSAFLDVKNDRWQIPIHGWIYEPENSQVRKSIFAKVLSSKYDLSPTAETQANFDSRVNLFLADNERGKSIIIDIAGEHYRLPKSNPNGHFSAELSIPVAVVNRHIESSSKERGQKRLTFSAVTKHKEKRQFMGEVLLLEPAGISVISDIDDTIKISHVTEQKKLLENTFLKSFVSVPGMAEKYSQWEKDNVAFHFVSSSPWQLYTPLQSFVNQANFPRSTFSLKEIRYKDSTLLNLFKKGSETKPLQIERILKAYPHRKFVLIGDSGEEDPEAYTQVMRQHPDQIIKILIRNISDETIDNERIKPLLVKLKPGVFTLFTDPSIMIIPAAPF
jgi:Phosphatidate phosphatase APP1, catalytic domain